VSTKLRLSRSVRIASPRRSNTRPAFLCNSGNGPAPAGINDVGQIDIQAGGIGGFLLMPATEATTVSISARSARTVESYCKGLLLPGERKSVEPMAARLPRSKSQRHWVLGRHLHGLQHALATIKEANRAKTVKEIGLSAICGEQKQMS
jgi:hypothetical protein